MTVAVAVAAALAVACSSKEDKAAGVEGEWEGIGHCAVGYLDGEPPQASIVVIRVRLFPFLLQGISRLTPLNDNVYATY